MMTQWKSIGLVSAGFVLLLLAGCASTPQPYTYHNDRDEKPGPGLFSGDKGAYVIYAEDADPRQPADAKTTPVETE
jgi:hypothetical protein